MAGKHLAFILSIVVLATSSCTKIIDLRVSNSAPTLDIEGVVDNSGQPATVKISTSQQLSDSSYFIGVTNAVVVISSSAGVTDTLKQTSPGIYQSALITGTPGITYTMNAFVNGAKYTAQSTMPGLVPFISLQAIDITFSGDTTRAMVPIYQDPASVPNYYRFKVFRNQVADQAIFVRSDDLNNGLVITQPLFRTDSTLYKGDTATVTMMGIDSSTHLYFYSLNQIAASRAGRTATPTNPVTNISGGCLGYFSAQTIQTKTLILQN